jgi:hypothetical protein
LSEEETRKAIKQVLKKYEKKTPPTLEEIAKNPRLKTFFRDEACEELPPLRGGIVKKKGEIKNLELKRFTGYKGRERRKKK